MKIVRALLKSTPLVLACCIASAATIWTPVACGCVEAWQGVAWSIGRQDIKKPEQLTALVIADGIAKTLRGKTVKEHDLPFTESTSDCAVSSVPSRTVRCRWWLWESGSDKKGYDIVVDTDRKGVFQRVSVVTVVYTDPTVRR